MRKSFIFLLLSVKLSFQIETRNLNLMQKIKMYEIPKFMEEIFLLTIRPASGIGNKKSAATDPNHKKCRFEADVSVCLSFFLILQKCGYS